MQRAAKLLSDSALVPEAFRGNISNCTIALEMASRMGASPLAVMQNLYIVHGRPSWSSQFIIAAVNSTGKFTPIRFVIEGSGDDRSCVAWATERGSNERLESPPISIGMSKKEGWFGKNGSKWQTMPELMLRYRAATLFGRLYAPEVLMGMQTADEVEDTISIDAPPVYACETCGLEMSPTIAAVSRKAYGRQVCISCTKSSTAEAKRPTIDGPTEPPHVEPAPEAPPASVPIGPDEPDGDPIEILQNLIIDGKVNKARLILAARRVGCQELASKLELPNVAALGEAHCRAILGVLP